MTTISEYAALEQYKDYLDEVYGDISICGPSYNAAYALEQVDPIAFRCGFNGYLDSEELELA